MSKIVCPYCFNAFNQNELMFRCSNYLGCKKESDNELSKFWFEGAPIQELPFFAAPFSIGSSILGNVPKSAKCPKCKKETATLICPHCHSTLPRQFVEHKGHIISIIGARSSGKTNYIATFINTLRRTGWILRDMGVNLETTPPHMQPGVKNSNDRYMKDFFEPIYKKGICPPQTMVGDENGKYPVIISLKPPKKDPLYLVFYDTAGENFNEQRNIAANVQYIMQSDAFVFILDTAEVPFVRERLQLSPSLTSFDSIVSCVMDFFANSVNAKEFYSKPIAFTFNKIDLILKNPELFSDASIPNMSWESNSSYLDGTGIRLSEIDSVSDGLKAILYGEHWDQANFIKRLENTFTNMKLFGVSGLGEDPKQDKKISNLRPYRILDPLVWILHQFNYPLPIVKE